jgi:hypothetical protein
MLELVMVRPMLDFADAPAYDDAPSTERDLADCVTTRVGPEVALLETASADDEREDT